MKVQIPDDASVIEPIFKEMKENFKLGIAKDMKFRKSALKTFVAGYESMKEQISAALKKDLGLNQFMAEFGAHSITLSEIRHLIAGLKWAEQKRVPTPIGLGIATCSIKPEPLGLVLVISAWNYPIYTAIPQVAAAISAGNCVILKPSELAPNTSRALANLFEKHMDKRFYRVIEGKIEVAKAITRLPFDMICFTGSTQTGRLVAIQAAKNLTPCLLQLGGKCPAILDETANLQSACMSILFGKYFNCGQTCIGVDHVYVHESIKTTFLEELKNKMEQFYGGGQNLSEEGNYGKIINDFHVNRLEKLLKDQHGGKVIYGGTIQKQKQYISPTVIQSPKKDSMMMKQEIFGPIMPIHYYSSLKDVVQQVNNRAKPLVVYMFSQNSKNYNYVNQNTSSGAFTHNDSIVQMLNADLPFGGVGGSGYGRFHGQSGFVAFSNPKSVTHTKAVNRYPMNQRFPPYTESKKATMTKLLKFGSITYSKIGKVLLILIIVIGVALFLGLALPQWINK